MWRCKKQKQSSEPDEPPEPPEPAEQSEQPEQRAQDSGESPKVVSAVVNATPLAVIQPTGLNGKTAGLVTETQPTVGPTGEIEESPQTKKVSIKRGLCRRGGSRLVHPRVSLWGKPVQTRQRPGDPRYRKFRFQVNNFLERPRGWKAMGYHMIV